MLGDGESAEGSVWESAQVAAHHHLDNLCAITDLNGLGQSAPTQWDHDSEAYVRRWSAFGWHAIGDRRSRHGGDSRRAGRRRVRTTGRPTMIVARTLKGKGVKLVEGKEGWHGKAFKKGAETDQAIAELQAQRVTTNDPAPVIPSPEDPTQPKGRCPTSRASLPRRATSSARASQPVRRSAPASSRLARSTRASSRSTPT